MYVATDKSLKISSFHPNSNGGGLNQFMPLYYHELSNTDMDTKIYMKLFCITDYVNIRQAITHMETAAGKRTRITSLQYMVNAKIQSGKGTALS